jgi:hypothetical protein
MPSSLWQDEYPGLVRYSTAYAPEFSDRLAKQPIALRTQRSIDRCLNDGDTAEVLAKHKTEGDEDTMV